MNFCNERTRTVSKFLFTSLFINSLYFIMKLYQSSMFKPRKNEHEKKISNFFRLYYYYDAAADAAGISIHFQTLGKKIDIFRIKSPKEKNHTHSRLTDWLTDWFSRVHTFALWRSFFSNFFSHSISSCCTVSVQSRKKWWIHTVPTKYSKIIYSFFCGMKCLFVCSRATFKSIEFTLTCVDRKKLKNFTEFNSAFTHSTKNCLAICAFAAFVWPKNPR